MRRGVGGFHILFLLFLIPLCALSQGKDCAERVASATADSDSDLNQSHFGIVHVGGPVVACWTDTSCGLNEDALQCQIAPGQAMVIGRSSGSRPEYLDESFTPTCLAPNGMSVLNGSDNGLSRAHFMLRQHPKGIVLVNGVPKKGGGIRAPTNGTLLLSPDYRALRPEEELVIENGTAVKIRLPNSTILLISAGE